MDEAKERDAVICDDAIARYDELLKGIEAARGLLCAHRIERGRTVALVGDFDATTIAYFLALIECDAIITPLTPASEARHPEFLEISEVQQVVRIGGGDQPRVETAERTVRNALTRGLQETGSAGLVLYSSGSSGRSKGALHDFAPLLAKFQPRRTAFRTLSFLLLDHIGGINTLFHTLANAGTVVAVRDRHPANVCAAIEKYGVELLPTSPAFLNLLLMSREYDHHDMRSLKLITYGTEPMPQSTLARVAATFPGVSLQQTYGLTEVGILRSQSRERDSLWVRIGGEGYETKVVEGILWIRAHSSMLGYLNAPSPFDAEGWLCTNDLVEVDGEYVRFLGRGEEIINVGGQKVYPAEVESAILALPNIQDVVVFGEPHPLTGQVVVAALNVLVPEPTPDLKHRVRSQLRGRLDPYKIPQRVIVTDEATYNERFKRLRLQRSRASGPPA